MIRDIARGVSGIVLAILALCGGCQRAELFDLAKEGAGLVYAMGDNPLTATTWLYVAGEEYFRAYDTHSNILPTSMVVNSRGRVLAVQVGIIYTHFGESYEDTWNPVTGNPPFVSIEHLGEEFLVLDTGTQIYTLHEDSSLESNPWTDVADISGALGSYIPQLLFRDFASGAVFLYAGGPQNAIFRLSPGNLLLVYVPDGAVFPLLGATLADYHNGYFYASDYSNLYRMNASNSLLEGVYPVTHTSFAVVDSGIYYVFASADLHFNRLKPPAPGASTELHVFIGSTDGSVMPFRGGKVAIRVNGSVSEDGIWIYGDGKLKRIISASTTAMYSR
jgi:hypothetical protein